MGFLYNPLINTIRDLIGSPTDIWSITKTVFGYNNVTYQHIHNAAKCYPSLANGVTVSGGSGIWQLGNFIEVIPSNTISRSFDIHWINFESASANDVYELVLYSGNVGNEVEIGRIRTYKTATQTGAINVPIQMPPQLANSRISAKLASASGGDTVTISLFYHQYN